MEKAGGQSVVILSKGATDGSLWCGFILMFTVLRLFYDCFSTDLGLF